MNFWTSFLSTIQGGTALDIGAGSGKDSVCLAKYGFKVDVIEINKNSSKKIKELAQELKLNINVFAIDIKQFNFPALYYNVVLAIQSLVFLKKTDFRKVLSHIKATLKPDGIAVISVFTTADPSFARMHQTLPEVETNTFLSPRTQQYWQFMESDELKQSFNNKDYTILFYEEKIVDDPPHSNTPYIHKHGIARIVAQKKRAS